MTEITLEAVKAKLGSKTDGRGYRVYSGEARAMAVAYANERIASGARLEEVWVELGLKDWTLQRWLQRARKKSTESESTGFKRLEVKAADEAKSPLVVVGPGGVRVEGLHLPEVVELLRRLSCSV